MQSRNSKIVIMHGMSGFFAAHVAEFSDDGGKNWYQDVWNTGIGRYKSSKEAEPEAEAWAKAEEIPFNK